MTADWHKELYKKWLTVHDQFRYCSPDTPYSVTINQKTYFETKTDVNRFSAFKRLMEKRVYRFLNKKRLNFLRNSIHQWKGAVGQFLEANLISTHINENAIDIEEIKVKNSDSATFQNDVLVSSYDKWMKSKTLVNQTERLNDIRTLGYELTHDENLTSIPFRIPDISRYVVDNNTTNTNDEESEDDNKVLSLPPIINESHRKIPSYFPSEVIRLPPLQPIYDPKSAAGRLELKNEKRVDFSGYGSTMEGPSDDSYWIIPGMLSGGGIPLLDYTNIVKGKSPVPPISSLMLSGVDYFISLMEESEEEGVGRELAAPTLVPNLMKTAFMNTNMSASQIILDNTAKIEKQTNLLNILPTYILTDPRYQANYRERLRIKARIKLASENIYKAKKEIKNLPKKVDWLRLPLPVDRVPPIDDILPSIWEVEAKLSEGKRVYMYGKDGHGRAGMVGAIIVGRLYGLHPYEVNQRLYTSNIVLCNYLIM